MRALFSRIVIIGSVVVTACAPAPPAQPAGTDTRPAEQRSANQVLRISTASVQQSASPEASAVNVWGNSIMFDSLTRLDAQLRVQPGVAERWEALPNNEGWRYTIRRDLFWPDGTRVTAADVEFTMRTAIANRWP
ncbi:MAG: ABC transporter substrate-binding protein, partial [Dehalococcoidia bacterium]|nr:ABC transporter substrate-binding protein [Dehalococcoidia bacterium]